MQKPGYVWSTVGLVCLGLTFLAIVAAWRLQASGLLSLSPPPSDAMPTPGPDVTAGDALGLYQSAFTAWVALVLLIPAYTAFWFRNGSGLAWTVWLSCWSIGAVAYLVHLAVSMFGFFGGDFGWMTSTTRVSAFWPGMVIAIWWPLDAVLALTRGEKAGWIRVQRIAIHLIALILFVGGSAVKGELLTVRVIGTALFLAALTSPLLWTVSRIRSGKTMQVSQKTVAPPTN